MISGPLSVDQVEDDADVDVEQCSDSEAHSRSRASRTASNNSRATPTSDEERLTPEPVRKKVHTCLKVGYRNSNFRCLQNRQQIVGSCNSDDLRPIQCHLETKELWDKFHDLGTEMIITKTGR